MSAAQSAAELTAAASSASARSTSLKSPPRDRARKSPQVDREPAKNSCRAYNAIKLTNYYTNLLFNAQQPHQQIIDQIGESWRAQQLLYQIPRQDTELLASESGASEPSTEHANNDTNSDTSGPSGAPKGTAPSSSDEIKFIEGQRKSASQFKASLYYLSPTNCEPEDPTGRLVAQKSAADNYQPQQQASGTRRNELNCCFKVSALTRTWRVLVNLHRFRCAPGATNSNHRLTGDSSDGDKLRPGQCKKPIEFNSTCVRVDNLQLSENNSSQTMKFSGQKSTVDAANLEPLPADARQQADASLGAKQTASASITPETPTGESAPNSEQSATGASGPHNQDDEGLGTGSSSGQSSASGSHCDNRETPPLVSCADDEMAEEREKPREDSKPVDSERRPGAKTKSSAGGKTRSSTWSASLNLLSASLRGHLRSRSESDLKSSAKREQQEDQDNNVASILFHTECFSCSTCSQLLVDLRALIYVNEPKNQKVKPAASGAKRKSSASCEYVNLDCEDTTAAVAAAAGEQEPIKNSNELHQQQVISLYCHRHFVELFKPRCQQCDCLILDEECTEAEGKVWHIKHFCCTECKVPLGGHQYIIVDHSNQREKLRVGAASTTGAQLKNAPYCLRCFDKVFGETCSECGKLITCDSGAINHEQRCWHASPACFKCYKCRKSLLGSPFLPCASGRIYCSFQCSELVEAQQPRGNLRALSQAPNQQASLNLSLANYWDPRVVRQQQLAQPLGLLRHRPLIEYLLTTARSDETSRQLLSYLYGQFQSGASLETPAAEQLAGSSSPEMREATQLMAHIGRTLDQIKLETTCAGNELSPAEGEKLADRRSRLNPFLIDSLESAAGGEARSKPIQMDLSQSQQQQVAATSATSAMTSTMMDDGRGATSASPSVKSSSAGADVCQSNRVGATPQLANYINLDCVFAATPPPLASAETQAGKPADLSGVNNLDESRRTSAPTETDCGEKESHRRQEQRAAWAQQQQVAASGTRQRFGVQGAFKASQCSPVASLISNEGAISDHSATSSSGVSSAAAGGSSCGALSHRTGAGGGDSHSPLLSSSSQDSCGQQHANQRKPATLTSASMERRRRVQPITELSVVDLLTVADDRLESQQTSDGFDRLVSHFESQQRALARPDQQQQQQQRGQVFNQHQVKHQESFFFELAQRLPKRLAGALNQQQSARSTGEGGGAKPSVIGPALGAGVQPLDTNGLPTVELPRQPNQRNVTDHYSTVNKANKTSNHQKQQQVAGDRSGYAPDEANGSSRFFAITSPLLNCQPNEMEIVAGGGASVMRSASSLSALASGDANYATGLPMTSGAAPSVGSGQQQIPATPSGQQVDNQMQFQNQQQLQPKKSVSFDPSVKEPPSSSSTLTLGRASTLKSALKSSKNWAHFQQQPQFDLGAIQGQGLAAGCATMPVNLAHQLKMQTPAGSLNAYSAYYDEFGRRVRLSSLLKGDHSTGDISALGADQLVMLADHDAMTLPQLEQGARKGGGLFAGALSKLSGASSRGGRREERNLRQQHQQVQTQQPLTIQTQPMSLLAHQQQAVAMQQVLVEPTSSGRALDELDRRPRACADSTRRHSNHRAGRSHRSQRPSHASRRPHHSRSSKSSHRRSGRSRSGGRHRRRRASGHRHCYESDTLCYDSEVSSRCSTCSDSSSDSSSCDSDSDNDEVGSSSNSEWSGDDYDSSSVSSYSSRSDDDGASCTSDEYDSSSRSSSPSSRSDSSAYSPSSSPRRQSNDSSAASSSSRSRRRRYEQRAGRAQVPASSHRRRGSSGRRSSHRRNPRHRRSASKSSSSNRSNSTTSSSSRRRSSSRRSGRPSDGELATAGENVQPQGRRSSKRIHSSGNNENNRSQSNRHHRRSHSMQHQPQIMAADPNGQNMNFYSQPSAASMQMDPQATHLTTQAAVGSSVRPRSPSTISTGSRSALAGNAKDENCKII